MAVARWIDRKIEEDALESAVVEGVITVGFEVDGKAEFFGARKHGGSPVWKALFEGRPEFLMNRESLVGGSDPFSIGRIGNNQAGRGISWWCEVFDREALERNMSSQTGGFDIVSGGVKGAVG